MPSFAYREEGATITDVKSNIDFANSSITYTITAISDALSLTAGTYNFPRRNAKPSEVIKEILCILVTLQKCSVLRLSEQWLSR
jgi:hypothetical protein